MWKLLNLLTGRGKSKKNIEPENITQYTADEHNEYFATIGTKIQEELKFKKSPKPKQTKKTSELPEFVFQQENSTKIKKIIDNIKLSNVAVGCDNIGMRILKDLKEILAPILVSIINIGYETSTFPSWMKRAVVKALHKKGSPANESKQTVSPNNDNKKGQVKN